MLPWSPLYWWPAGWLSLCQTQCRSGRPLALSYPLLIYRASSGNRRHTTDHYCTPPPPPPQPLVPVTDSCPYTRLSVLGNPCARLIQKYVIDHTLTASSDVTPAILLVSHGYHATWRRSTLGGRRRCGCLGQGVTFQSSGYNLRSRNRIPSE